MRFTRLAATTAACAMALAFATQANAYDVAPGWIAADYATGFPHYEGDHGVGPVGLVFDPNANLLVDDPSAGALYRIPPGGGSAADHKVRDGYGQSTGLAYDLDGRLYMARRDTGDVIEIDPADGHYVRTVFSGMPCPVGLATDPLSGDLFVANNFCPGGGIIRISGYKSGPGTGRKYAGDEDADGLTFGPDGTLYAAAGVKVVQIDGTNSSTPGRETDIAAVPEVDGIAYAPATATDAAYLVVARNDGEIDRVDFNGNLTAIVQNASRGDLVTVGPDRCIYADLQDRIMKLGPSTGSCSFAPIPGGGGGGQQDVLGERVANAQKRVVDVVVRSTGPKRVRRGARFVYKLTVANHGPGTAHRVVLTDRLARGLRFVKARTSDRKTSCRQKRGVVTCRRSSLAKGKSFTVKITVVAIKSSSYLNRVSVRSADLDPVMGNNARRLRTRVR